MKSTPWDISLQIGQARHDRQRPHHVLREGGCTRWLIEYVHSGGAWVELAEGIGVLRTGDWIAFTPGTRQHYGMQPAWRHTWCCFTPRPHWLEWLQWPQWNPGILKLSLPEGVRPECERLIKNGLALRQRHWNRREDILLNHIERILLFLDHSNPNNASAILDERIRRAVDLLCAQPEADLSVSDLAHHCHLSPSRFAHLFRETLGLTPMQYREQQRIRRARELLLMTSRPITEIAFDCGYGDPLLFSRVFRKHERISPRNFRQNHRPSPPHSH